MEATEELRQRISRSLRRASRVLAKTEPDFPNIFVTKRSLETIAQGFGLFHDEEGNLVFEQDSLDSAWGDGIVARASFLQFVDQNLRNTQLVNAIANGFAYAIISENVRDSWRQAWLRVSKDTPVGPIMCHLERHAKSYRWNGFSRLLDFLQIASLDLGIDDTKSVLTTLHESHEVALGHDEHMIIQSFCRSLQKPRQLATKSKVLDVIHLNPRALFDPGPLGISLHLQNDESPEMSDEWLMIRYQDGDALRVLQVGETGDNPLRSLQYRLRLQDIFPKSGGLVSQGRDVIDWILRSIGIETKSDDTFNASISFNDRPCGAAETAVLERLAEGKVQILENTLVGSLQRVETLLTQERITFVPDFNHMGIELDFLIKGAPNDLQQISDYTLESTIFSFANASYMVSCASGTWRKFLLKAALEKECSVWPIVEAKSKRRLIRSETLFEDCVTEI